MLWPKPLAFRQIVLGLIYCFCAAGIAFGASPAAIAVQEPVKVSAELTTRIVSLVPNITELIFSVEAGAEVVGVSDFCNYPPEARSRPTVGGLINPSLEGVLRLKPTVVMLFRSQQDFAVRLAQLGIQTELFQVDSLVDLHLAIDRVGLITGHVTQANSLGAAISRDLSAIQASAQQPGAPIVKGIVLVSRDPAGLRSMYQGSFLGEILQLAGGTLAVGGGASISQEDVIRAMPDVIIDMSGSETHDPTSSPTLHQKLGPWGAVPIIPAVKNNQVYLWKNPHSMLLGPSVVETAIQMRQIIQQAAAAKR